MNVVPLPATLDGPASAIQCWAEDRRTVSAVYVYGSRLRGTEKIDSDLDIAVAFDAPEGEEKLIFWIDHKPRWEQELAKCTSMRVHLEIGDPVLAPCVWSYLQKGHARLYRRD